LRLQATREGDGVDEHRVGEDGRRVGAARPGSPHRDVEEDEEGMVEGPGLAGLQVGGRPGQVQGAVHEEADRAGLPLYGEDVEAVGERLPAQERVGAGQRVPAREVGTVQRAVDDRRLAPDVLYDVNLA